jgi:hypothetical protein
MGVTIWIFGISVILICIVLIITLISPQNWGQASAGCNQNCSGGSAKEAAANRGLNDSDLIRDQLEKETKLINADGEQKLSDRKTDEILENLKMTPDPYSQDVPFHIWKTYLKEKQETEKNKFINQCVYVITPKIFVPFKYKSAK